MTTRSISKIAFDISKNWPNPYFGAVPYIRAMKSLDSINDHYHYESARSVVLYFLSNAKTWRGEQAKAIKAELRSMAGL